MSPFGGAMSHVNVGRWDFLRFHGNHSLMGPASGPRRAIGCIHQESKRTSGER
jgi:hypothetical protein